MKKANSNWSESENQDIWKDLAETIKKIGCHLQAMVKLVKKRIYF